MAFNFHSIWARLANNWEPVTAVSDLIVIAWSIVLAYQGICLANRGAELAQQVKIEAIRSAILSRTPVFSPFLGSKSISVKSLGLGPGNLYQINVSVGELQTTIENSDPRQAAEELEISWKGGLHRSRTFLLISLPR